MNTTEIREQLHHFLEVADDKKIKAMYVMLEDSLKESQPAYTETFKKELDERVDYYLNGGKMVTADEMRLRLKTIRAKRNS